MKKIYSLFIFLTISFSLLGQNITVYNPNQGETIDDRAQNLVLTFDQAISFNPNFSFLSIRLHNDDLGSIVESWICINGTGQPGVSISVADLIINPAVDLLEGTNYHIEIDAGAIDGFGGIDNSAGNNWRFATSSPLTYYPLQDATDVPLADSFTLTFQDDIAFNPNFTFPGIRLYNGDTDGLIESWTCTLGSASPGVSILNNVLTINPASNLSEGGNYYIIIDDGAIDGYSGIDNSAGNNWRFTAITFPPTVTLYVPDQDETNIGLNPSLQLTFDRDVQFITPLAEYKILLRQGGVTIDEFIVSPGFVDGNLSFDGNLLTTDRLTITPYSTLEVNTEYHVIIPSGLIESLLGAPFTGITSSTGWSFTTLSEPEWATGYPLTRNILPNSVDLAGQTDKTGTYYYVVTSSATAPNDAQIKAGQDETGSPTAYTSGSGAMTADNEFIQSIDISNHILYLAETTYYVHLISTDGGTSLDSSIETINFTTLERTPPVTSFDPSNGATGISILTDIVISFDEAVRMTNGTVIDDSNLSSLISFYLAPANPIAFTATINAEKTMITIVPDAPLTEESTYNVSLFAVEDYYGNQQLSSSSSSFTTASVITWNGSQSSIWTDNDNWNGDFVEGISVTILSSATNMPVITTDITVGNIIIEAGASLEIQNTGSLVVNESLTMESSTSGSGNASLIDNGHTPVSVDPNKVEIYQQINASDRTYYVSSPVSGATKNSIGVDNAIGSYNNATDDWYWMGDSEELVLGTGYALRTSSNLTFSGAINSNVSYGIMLSRTDGQGFGWNLIGNPYPAALDWDLIGSGLKVNINDAYWIFLNDAVNYGVYATYSPLAGGTNGLDNLIPSNQGFFVKVLSGSSTGALTMPKSVLKANNKSILKNGTISYPKIKLAGVNGQYKDETIIAFADIAEDELDRYDATKRFGSNSNYIELYSFEDSESYAINCKNELRDNLVIPLGYYVKNKGSFSIKLATEENIFANYDVILEDKFETQMINLNETNIYSFTAEQTGKVNNRFALHFTENTLTTEIDKSNTPKEIDIYSHSKTIYISGEFIKGSRYEIYATNGRLIKNGLLNSTNNTIKTNLDGLFIVKIINKNESFTGKVLLK